MNKVYADKSLGYDQTERFKLPEGFDPCGSGEGDPSTTPTESTGIDDLFR
ncbi:hypothetical protein SDC9_143341 [bioreactor metagenome]|uniref:Uncharacterized protein n=2 Tax=root TaxID=1 RepID=A0A645E5V3_9ZZZZ